MELRFNDAITQEELLINIEKSNKKLCINITLFHSELEFDGFSVNIPPEFARKLLVTLRSAIKLCCSTKPEHAVRPVDSFNFIDGETTDQVWVGINIFEINVGFVFSNKTKGDIEFYMSLDIANKIADMLLS